MGVLNSAFMFDVESNMRVIAENSYVAALAKNQWWRTLAKEMPSGSKKERILWLIETGFLQYGVEGQQQFIDLAMQTLEFESKFINGSGLKLLKSQMEDLDGGGVQASAAWARTMGALAAYFPQQELAKAIIANPTAYDGIAFFHANAGGTTGHPLDPTDTSKGRFANLFTGAASANNPGACPINGVSPEVAQQNVSKALTYIRNIKQPNGVNPRNLNPVALIVPQARRMDAILATQAMYIAQAASSGGGSADVSKVIDSFGLGEPIVAQELGAQYSGGSDTSYYIACEDTGGQLGAFTYVNREAFSITFHGPMTDAQLASKREYEWLPNGRSVIGPGHPYLLFRVDAT